ncbi:unnamed protein product [Calypogeia fissa]
MLGRPKPQGPYPPAAKAQTSLQNARHSNGKAQTTKIHHRAVFSGPTAQPQPVPDSSAAWLKGTPRTVPSKWHDFVEQDWVLSAPRPRSAGVQGRRGCVFGRPTVRMPVPRPPDRRRLEKGLELLGPARGQAAGAHRQGEGEVRKLSRVPEGRTAGGD